jgi:hydroxymethylbilane synthase
VPIGGYAQIRDGQVDFRGFVADTEGRQMIVRNGRAPVDDAAGLGRRVAEQVLEAGGREILAEVYSLDLNPPGSGS